jgi:hypothetical protein
VVGSLPTREDRRAHLSRPVWRPEFFMIDDRKTVRPNKKGPVVVELVKDGMAV